MSLTNQDSDDTGEIEMYGTGSENVIEYNALHDIYDSSTSLSGSISTILTISSWICAGMDMCGSLPSPVCA